MTKVVRQKLSDIHLGLIRFFYFHQPSSERSYLFGLGLKPACDSHERRGGSFHEHGSGLLGTKARVCNSNLVLARLADVIWTDHKPVTDEECERLKTLFRLPEKAWLVPIPLGRDGIT